MDDLTSKLVAAAETAIKEATPPEAETTEETAQAAPEEAEPEVPAGDDTEEDVSAEEPEAENETHASAEEAPTADFADEILAVRASAERKVRQAEKRAAALEAQLEKVGQTVENTKKQLVDELFRKLRRAPAKTFQEYGFNFQDLIDAGIREGDGRDSPMAEGLDELKQEIQALKAEREEARRQQAVQQQQQQLHAARNEFLSQVEKNEFPTLFNMFYDDRDALWREAVAVGREHQRRYGTPPEDREVIKHLEEKYKARIARLGGGTATPAAKKPMAKSLSTKAASETRTSGKPFGQLSADEQRDVLLAAAKKARQPSASN